MHIKVKDFEFRTFSGVSEDTCLLSFTVEYPDNIEKPYVSKSYSGCHVCELAEKPLSLISKFIENSVIISDRLSAFSNQFQIDMNKKYGANPISQDDVKEFGTQYRSLSNKLKVEFPLNAEYI